MNTRILIGLFLIFGFVSCEIKPKTPVVKPTKFDKKIYKEELVNSREKTKKKKVVQTKKDSVSIQPKIIFTTDTISLKFNLGKVKIDTAKSENQQLVFLLNSDTANKIDLKISAQDTLNHLIIHQIIDPNGNAEGPFESNFIYEIKEKGEHKIIVSDNPEQQPWAGKFTFSANLKW